MALTLPIEVYEAFEKGLGYEESKDVVKAFETAISDITDYKWHTNREEILSEVRKEFLEVRRDFSELRREFLDLRKETDRKFYEMDRKFTDLIEKKFSELDKKFAEVDKKFGELDKKFATKTELKTELALLEGRMNERFTRIEAKMDVESKRVDGELKAIRLEMNERFTRLEGNMDGEFKRLETKMDGEFKAMRLEMKIFFLLIALLILATNPRTLDMIAKVFGFVK
ncbi:MAG: hypothetical protein HQL03_06840 [Nitrospirae bacterium]|nr:hypothetical protein [Nitrospirota bacterium]MBF0592792.1 hypothetical protein [Nitrospirota bacterium]